MKFVPRQPLPPPDRSNSRTSTTRFLRLQEADDVPRPAKDGVKFEPPPLPEFTPPVNNADRTRSGRVRLRLDPKIASQPLPRPVRQPELALFEPATVDPTPAQRAEEQSESLLAVNDVALAATATEPAWQAETLEDHATYDPPITYDHVVYDQVEEAPVADPVSGPDPEPEIVAPESQAFEMPPVAEVANQVWVAPGPVEAAAPEWVSEEISTEPPVEEPTPEPVSEPVFEVPRPMSIRRRTEPVHLPETRVTRPELRKPGLSPAHQKRAEQPLGRGFWFVLFLLVIIILGALYFFWLAPRMAMAQAQSGHLPAVAVDAYPVSFEVVHRATPVTELPVTGTVQPSRETPIYSRTTGYVKAWHVDIGDHVETDEVLAELDTPDVDHQLVQSRAIADQAKAALALAQNEADRWTKMAHDHAVAQADADAKVAAFNQAKAADNAAEAAVSRLVDLEIFKEIKAPYSGTITARNVEVGTLVGVGPGPTGTELFRIIQTDPVRIFVDVPDAAAPSIRAHLPAKLQVAAYPGRIFTGEVVRDAGALDAKTHTLRTEIHVANPDGALLPGTAADVHLLLFDPTPALLVPSNTLVRDSNGTSVVRVVPDGGREIARFTPVKVGREVGSDVEISADVQAGDRLVANPPPDLKDGMVVDARAFEAAPAGVPTLLPPKPSAPRA